MKEKLTLASVLDKQTARGLMSEVMVGGRFKSLTNWEYGKLMSEGVVGER